MPNLTGSRRQKLEWIEARLDAWGSDPAAVGLSPQQVALLRDHAESTRASMMHSITLHNSAKSATRDFHTKAAEMTALARDLVATVKAFARTSGDDEVYVRSNVTPAAPPSSSPAPEAPSNVTGTISSRGEVTLAWDASIATGTFFLIERASGANAGNAAFTLLGGTAQRTLTDPAPHLASGPVLYRVRAVRGDQMSAWTVPVVFDVRPGTELVEPRLAA